MKTLAFASRNAKELQRDVLTSIFGIAFPIVLLVLLSVINSSIPKEAHMTLFEIKNLTGGISAFGLVFLSLFSALLVSKDRCTAFIIRLYASPLKPSGYILGYTVPLIPMARCSSELPGNYYRGVVPYSRTGRIVFLSGFVEQE